MNECSSCQYPPPTVAWDWTHRGRTLNVDTCPAALGCLLPQSFRRHLVGMPLRPLLPPAATRLDAANVRRLTGPGPCCGGGGRRLERVPTPIPADMLLVGPGDEHKVRLCFHGESRSSHGADVKAGLIPDVARTSASKLNCDHGPRTSRSYRNNVTAGVADTEADHSSTVPASTVMSSRSGETDLGLASVQGDGKRRSNRLAPTPAVHRRPSRYRGAAVQQRQAVEFDAKYWERRRKNNEAAKRSRDIRRANERRVALRAALLERENARLRSEVRALTEDTLRLYYLLVSRSAGPFGVSAAAV